MIEVLPNKFFGCRQKVLQSFPFHTCEHPSTPRVQRHYWREIAAGDKLPKRRYDPPSNPSTLLQALLNSACVPNLSLVSPPRDPTTPSASPPRDPTTPPASPGHVLITPPAFPVPGLVMATAALAPAPGHRAAGPLFLRLINLRPASRQGPHCDTAAADFVMPVDSLDDLSFHDLSCLHE